MKENLRRLLAAVGHEIEGRKGYADDVLARSWVALVTELETDGVACPACGCLGACGVAHEPNTPVAARPSAHRPEVPRARLLLYMNPASGTDPNGGDICQRAFRHDAFTGRTRQRADNSTRIEAELVSGGWLILVGGKDHHEATLQWLAEGDTREASPRVFVPRS